MSHIEHCNKTTDFKFRYWIPGWNVSLLGAPSLICRQRDDLKPEEWDGINEALHEEMMGEPLRAMYGVEWRERKHRIEVIEIAQNTALDGGGILNEWPSDMNIVGHHGMWIRVVFQSP